MDVPEGAESRPRPRAVDATFSSVLGCFVLSGFAALLYQTAWMRQFSVVFGTSELAVATVLASYMGGLALGAALAGWFVTQVRRPVLVYGLLELGIAVTALAVPFALRFARVVQTAILGGQADLPDAGGTTNALFYLASAFVILAVPTAFMGATLPLLTRHAVRRREQIGSRVGLLYAMNTAGAVVGVIAAAFLLLPALGLWGTLLVGAAVNAVVFVIAASLGRGPGSLVEADRDHAGREPARRQRLLTARAAWILPIMLASGAVSFTYEVLWTRLLGHLLGASIFAFATMLASFLTGITLGSAVASRFATDRDRSVRGFVVVQIGTAALSIAIFYSLDRLPGLAAVLEASAVKNFALAAAVLLPATLCIGATFPFAVRILARDEHEAGPVSARVYAWNTAGAITGAVLAGFVLIPLLRFEGMVLVAVLVSLGLAFAATLLRTRPAWPLPATTLVLLLVVAVVFRPGMPERILRASPLPGHGADGRLTHYGVGRSATVVMLERDGWFNILSNGYPESSVQPDGSVDGLEAARWLAALPAVARPEARSMLIVGFGGGTSISGVPSWIADVDVVEIEPEIIEANRFIADRRADDPLRDPRVRVCLNDARGALAVTTKRYDVIVSQPSHPWTAGASHLYTREFMQEAREHLNPGGVFVQWMNAAFVDEALMKTLGATLLDVFAEVRVYCPEASMLTFLASDEPLDVEATMLRHDLVSSFPEDFRRIGARTVADVAVRLVLGRPGLEALCRAAPLNTDDRNRFATEGPRALARPLGAKGVLETAGPFDPLADADGPLHGADELAIDWVYAVGRLVTLGQLERAALVAEAVRDERQRLLASALVERARRKGRSARRLMLESMAMDRSDQNARFGLVEANLTALAWGAAPDDIQAYAAALEGPEAAVVAGFRHEVGRQWSALSELDDVLGDAGSTDFCFYHAIRLRAAWRVEQAEAENEPALAAEALETLDRLLPQDMTWTAYALRARAAAVADQPRVVLESVAIMTKRLSAGTSDVPIPRRRSPKKAAEELRAMLTPLAAADRVDPDRLAEVMKTLQPLLEADAEAVPDTE